MKIFHYFVSVFFFLVALPLNAKEASRVGFFAPNGVAAEMVEKTDFATINVLTPQLLEESFAAAAQSKGKFRVNLDIGALITDITPPNRLRVGYVTSTGEAKKMLPPRSDNKLRTIVTDTEITRRLAAFIPLIKKYAPYIDTVFLVDEPYLNGIPKAELERAATTVRSIFDTHAVPNKKMGILFASAMFNREFAQLMERTSGAYVQKIDAYYREGGQENPAEWERWKKIIPDVRLTTYDSAGNMFSEGGLPRGFDVFSFDFYLSTLLLDELHENTLDFFSKINPQQCKKFSGQTMKAVRGKLSFFHSPAAGKSAEKKKMQDRKILDAIFTCRMGTVTALLKKEIRKSYGDKRVGVILTTEASNNGVLQFAEDGSVLATQNPQATEDRVLDEVRRATAFHRAHRNFFSEGIMFFTYHNEYDNTIKLNIGGAKSMPKVMNGIASMRRPPAKSR